MIESTTVAVGLDVHARSIRLAAVRADELLEERTLPYDVEAVERALRQWPAVPRNQCRPSLVNGGMPAPPSPAPAGRSAPLASRVTAPL